MDSIKTTIYLFSLLLLLALVIMSCKKKTDSLEAPPAFLFGTSYGECGGDCDHYFALKDGQLYPTSGKYFPGPIVISNSPLSADKTAIAQQLLSKLPAYLLSRPNKEFGCPDCHDQGGIHIEYATGSDIMKWHIDTDTTALDPDIRSFSYEVLNTIEELEK
jgi:hypothetical protein